MTRKSTEVRDREIMRHWRKGLGAKEIMALMTLTTVWIAFDAKRRWKQRNIKGA